MRRRQITLRPVGELDLAAAVELRTSWFQIADERRPRTLTIDLSDVTFIDTAGIGLLVVLRTRQRHHGGALAVVGAAPALRPLLTVGGLIPAVTEA